MKKLLIFCLVIICSKYVIASGLKDILKLAPKPKITFHNDYDEDDDDDDYGEFRYRYFGNHDHDDDHPPQRDDDYYCARDPYPEPPNPRDTPKDEKDFNIQNVKISPTIVAAFKKWLDKYERKYQTEEEYYFRLFIFAENYELVNKHNSCEEYTYKLELNQFADQTKEEFLYKYLNPRILQDKEWIKLIEKYRVEIDKDLIVRFPHKVDWRKRGAVTEVKNQGSCGSCWAFSTTGLLEGINYLRGRPLTSFSEQQLLDCCGQKGYLCQGCNGAWPEWAVRYVEAYGILRSSWYPYIGYESKCRVRWPTFFGFYVSQHWYVPRSVAALRGAVRIQPVSVALDASNWGLYASGVFNNCSDNLGSANHAVLLVGYNRNGEWILKNSWSTSWGDSGYITLASGNTCGIYNYALVAK